VDYNQSVNYEDIDLSQDVNAVVLDRVELGQKMERLKEIKEFEIYLQQFDRLRAISYEKLLNIPADNMAEIVKQQVAGKLPVMARSLIETLIQEGKAALTEAKVRGLIKSE
jgi:NADPH-dependent 7-cyano-7-deazaguanine reductase QueF-like protein